MSTGREPAPIFGYVGAALIALVVPLSFPVWLAIAPHPVALVGTICWIALCLVVAAAIMLSEYHRRSATTFDLDETFRTETPK